MDAWLETHRILCLVGTGVSTTAALWLVGSGQNLIRRGLRDPQNPDQSALVVRGIRRGIVAIGLLFLAGGFFWATHWPFIFAAVFLGEELFETGIMLAALHDQRKEEERRAKIAAKKSAA